MLDRETLVCSNCGEDDYSKFINCDGTNDEHSTVCTSCGCVQVGWSNFDYSNCGAKRTEEDSDNVLGRKAPRFSGRYARRVHFVERLSAHNRKEPAIPDHILQLISSYQQQYLQHAPFHRYRTEQKCLGKRDIQNLLRFIDRQEKKKLKEGEKPPKICKLYLERWVSIVVFLNDQEIPEYTPEQANELGPIFEQLSGIWDRWQPPYKDKEERADYYKFKNRKHFPNFNFVFQKLHEHLGMPHYNKYFPKPTTKGALKRLNKYWEELRKEYDKSVPDEKKDPEEKPLKQLTLDHFKVVT